MFCPKCATQNADDAKYCRSCGTDISLVSQAVTGQLAERLADEDETRLGRRHRRRRGRDSRPPSIEHAVRKLFMGLAFIFVAFSVWTWMPGGSTWWFWMLIPAFGMIGDGVSTYFRLAEDKKRLAPPVYVPVQPAVAPPQRMSALPQRNTGEIVPPPSVTEGTTRHLNVPAARRPEDV
jgi:zinc-ribbon domain